MSELRENNTVDVYRLERLEPDLGFGEVWEAKDTSGVRWWVEVLDPREDPSLPVADHVANQMAAHNPKRRERVRLHAGYVRAVQVQGKEWRDKILLVWERDKHEPLAPWLSSWAAEPTFDIPRMRQGLEDVVHGIAAPAATAPAMVHGCFSPRSVAVHRAERGRWRVMDAGVARIARPRDAPDAVGTFWDYAAPEVVAHPQHASPRGDVFSLGVFLFDLLTGAPHHQDEGAATPWHRAVERAENVSSLLPQHAASGVPQSLWRVVAKALCLEPNQRYEDPWRFLEAAKKALDGWAEQPDAARKRPPLPKRTNTPALGATRNSPPHLWKAVTKPATDVPPKGPALGELTPLDDLKQRVSTQPEEGPNPGDSGDVSGTAVSVAQTVVVDEPPWIPRIATGAAPATTRSHTQPLQKLPTPPAIQQAELESAWDLITEHYHHLDLPTRPVDARYRILTKLAKATAEHLAWDLRTSSQVVLKVLSKRQVKELQRFYAGGVGDAREVFPGEVGDHVVRVLDLVLDGPMPYMVTELLRAESLEQRLTTAGCLDERAITSLIDDLALVLGHVAQRGQAHGDLRPAHLLFVRTGRLEVFKVARFGLAHPEDSPVASPEQLTVNTESPASDIWALGLLAFQLLTARPFWRPVERHDDVKAQILREDIPAASARGRVPLGFDAWFARCVVRDPGGRFPSVEAARTGLRKVLQHSSVQPVALTTEGAKDASRPAAPAVTREHQPLETGLATVRSLAISDDRQWLMAGGIAAPGEAAARDRVRSVAVWELESRSRIDFNSPHRDSVTSVATAGSCFATAGVDEVVCCWDPQTDEVRRLTFDRKSFPFRAVALGKEPHLLVVAGGPEGIPVMWRLGQTDSKFRMVASSLGHRGLIEDVAVAADSSIAVTAGDDHEIALWDLQKLRRADYPLRGHDGAVLCVALSVDATQVLSGGRDRTVRLWSLTRRHCEAVLAGHEGAVTDVAFVPGRPEALSSSCDGTVRRWCLESFRCLEVYKGHVYKDGTPAAVWCVASTGPDGFASGGSDGFVRHWKLEERT